MAIGTNTYFYNKSSYLTSLRVAIDSAALPAVIASGGFTGGGARWG